MHSICSIFIFTVVVSFIQLTGGKLLRLKYFDARGAAEISRVMLHLGNISYEDFRYPLTQKAEGGFEMREFSAAKESGAFCANMDRVPLLEVDGRVIGQSRAIERYIASLCGMLGKTPEDAAVIDCVAENVRDIKDKWAKIRTTGGFGPNAEKDALVEKWFAGGELSDWLRRLERSLPKHEGAGEESISYADVSIWHLLRDYFGDKASEVRQAEKRAGCLRLTRIADRLHDLESMQHYLRNRPANPF